MSGRKQHYIPQFILRSFGEMGTGKKVQVRVIGPDRTFIAPTDGIGAQREFYSKLNDDEVTLDDEITDAENEYSLIFHDLLNAKNGHNPDPLAVSRLITHLCIRGKHIRGSTSAAAAYTLRRAAELFSDPLYLRRSLGIGEPEPGKSLRDAFDEGYNERKALMRKAGISRHEFRKIMFSELNRRWGDLEDETIQSMVSLAFSINADRISTDAHNIVLGRDLEPEKRVAALASMQWTVKDCDKATYVLPDSIALSHASKSGAMPAMFVDNESLSGVIFPISPYRAVCGGSYRDDSLLAALGENFPLFASAASWEFVVAAPSFDFTKIDGSLIGQSAGKIIFDSVENAIQKDIAETLGLGSKT